MPLRMTAVELIVADMAASLAFYRRLDVPVPDGAETEKTLTVTLDSGVDMVFDSVEIIGPDYVPATGGPAITLAFDCGSPEGVDALYASLVADGVTGAVEPYDAPWGRRFSLVLDPDGNGVALYAELG